MADQELRYAVIGSGSKANSYYFEYDQFAFVIDNGFTLKEFKKRLETQGFNRNKIQAIFITHNHGDHIRGLETLARECEVPVYHHFATNLYGFVRDKRIQSQGITPGRSHKLGPLDFYPFPVYHDAPNALGYHFKIGGVTFTLITDTGQTDALMLRLAARSQVLFLEANYCPQMLEDGPYPRILKNRVASSQGHLSNLQAIDFLNQIEDQAESRLQRVYFIHLSENNNTVEALQAHLDEHLRWSGRYEICPRYECVRGELTDKDLKSTAARGGETT